MNDVPLSPDGCFFHDQSFYLPGSVDVNDRQMEQWNVRPPLLYLWSRHDWTDKHKAIAEEYGHVPKLDEAKIDDAEVSPSDHTKDYDENLNLGHDLLKPDDNPQVGQASENEGQRENLPYGNNIDHENQEELERSISNSNKTPSGIKHSDESDVISPSNNKSAVNNTYDGVFQHSQSRVFDGRPSADSFQSKSVITSQHPVEVMDDAYQRYEPTPCSRVEFGTAYSGNQDWPSIANPLSDYGARNLEEHGTGGFGYRPYFREEDRYFRDSDIRQQIRVYGIQEPEYMRSSYLSGDDPAYGHVGTGFGQFGMVPESSYMNSSTMQRYAPRLDESNHVRMRAPGSEPPIVGRITDNFERSVPPPPPPGFGSGPMAFAPAPNQAYSRHNSAGWLNE